MCLFLSPLSNCHHSLPKHTRLIPNFSILTNLGAHGAAISAGIAARDSFLTILGHTTAKQIPTLGFLPLFYPLTRCMCDYCPSPAPEQAKFSCNKPKTRTKNPGIIPCWKKKKKICQLPNTLFHSEAARIHGENDQGRNKCTFMVC